MTLLYPLTERRSKPTGPSVNPMSFAPSIGSPAAKPDLGHHRDPSSPYRRRNDESGQCYIMPLGELLHDASNRYPLALRARPNQCNHGEQGVAPVVVTVPPDHLVE